MTKLIIYDNKADSFICIDDMQRPLPFAPFCAPPLHSFLRLCHAETVWTDRRAIEALDATSRTWGAPLDARLAFKCFSPAAAPSPRMLGLTLKLNLAGLNPSERCELKRLMISMNDFEKVSESYESAGVLTATKRISCSCGTPLCFPEASVGSRGVYALLLQSALAANPAALRERCRAPMWRHHCVPQKNSASKAVRVSTAACLKASSAAKTYA